MPRDLPLGNGKLLVTFDSRYHLRDLYFPRIGGENHTGGHPFRFGLWTEGKFGWVHDDDWSRSLDYDDETMLTRVELACERLEVGLSCCDVVDFHETLYLRRIRVHNRADHSREIRLFFHQDFHISDLDVGDTAAYYPSLNAVIHYKGKRYFLVNARTEAGSGISDYATGYKEMPGREGTWRDAEGDGTLGKGPISQGSVDSTIALSLEVAAGQVAEATYWIGCGRTYKDVDILNQLTLEKAPETLFRRTAAYWRLWANKSETDFDDLPSDVVRLFKRSLLVLRTQIDDGGAIIAANDTDVLAFNRDTYSYMWPRDGALVAHSLILAGYESASEEFFRFCQPLLTEEGFFLHKYNPDGSAGSSWHPWLKDGKSQLPIQEDETALVLWALWKHFDRTRHVEFVKPLYRGLVVQAADFLCRFMDEEHDLPLPSYDLWEERHGVHAWTVGAVYGGLMAASRFAQIFEEVGDATRFRETAERIRSGAERYFWQKDINRFARMVRFHPDGSAEIDDTIDASIGGLLFFGMFDTQDPRIRATAQAIYDRLWIKTDVGGLARYENDYYHQVSQDIQNVPGNPWFICTLWIAQYFIARAQKEEELSAAIPALEWCVKHALPSGVMAEQVDPYTDDPISVSPLTWSHAALVTAVVEYLDRKSELTACPCCGQPTFTKERRKLMRNRAHHKVGELNVTPDR